MKRLIKRMLFMIVGVSALSSMYVLSTLAVTVEPVVGSEERPSDSGFESKLLSDGAEELWDSFLSLFDKAAPISDMWDLAGDIKGEKYDTSDSVLFSLMEFFGIESESKDDFSITVSHVSDVKDELETVDKVTKYVIENTEESQSAIDWAKTQFASIFGGSKKNTGREIAQNNVIVLNSLTYPIEVEKPNIYFYGYQGELEVTFEAPQLLKVSIPEYGNGWKVNALPDGTLENEENAYDFLFYECYTQKVYYQTESGFSLPAEERVERFTELLDAYGFTTEEKEDFIEYWMEKLESGSDYIMYPQYTETVDIAYPIKVTPEPDTSVRIWFVFRKDNGQEYVEEEIVPFERNGRTMFEWGGMVFD